MGRFRPRWLVSWRRLHTLHSWFMHSFSFYTPHQSHLHFNSKSVDINIKEQAAWPPAPSSVFSLLILLPHSKVIYFPSKVTLSLISDFLSLHLFISNGLHKAGKKNSGSHIFFLPAIVFFSLPETSFLQSSRVPFLLRTWPALLKLYSRWNLFISEPTAKRFLERMCLNDLCSISQTALGFIESLQWRAEEVLCCTPEHALETSMNGFIAAPVLSKLLFCWI